MNGRTKLDAWVEWRKRCALGLCRDETKAALQAWAKTLAFRMWSGTLTDQIDWAWHLFETQFILTGTARKNTPKVMMFAAAAAAPSDMARLGVLEEYAKKVLFSALRDCAVKETWGRRDATKGFQKLTVLRPDAPGAPSLEELLPDPHFRGVHPDSAAAHADLDQIAFNEAANWFNSLADRERVALGAFFSERSLAHPKVIELAGCEKSQVYKAKDHAVRPFVVALLAKYSSGNDRETMRELAKLALKHLGEQCARFFNVGKPPPD
jgi:hypothetical protein